MSSSIWSSMSAGCPKWSFPNTPLNGGWGSLDIFTTWVMTKCTMSRTLPSSRWWRGHDQHIAGSVQEDDGPFWRVRCNRNLKNQSSLNLLGFFEILIQNILHWVKNMKCRKLNHLSEYITFMYRKFA